MPHKHSKPNGHDKSQNNVHGSNGKQFPRANVTSTRLGWLEWFGLLPNTTLTEQRIASRFALWFASMPETAKRFTTTGYIEIWPSIGTLVKQLNIPGKNAERHVARALRRMEKVHKAIGVEHDSGKSNHYRFMPHPTVTTMLGITAKVPPAYKPGVQEPYPRPTRTQTPGVQAGQFPSPLKGGSNTPRQKRASLPDYVGAAAPRAKEQSIEQHLLGLMVPLTEPAQLRADKAYSRSCFRPVYKQADAMVRKEHVVLLGTLLLDTFRLQEAKSVLANVAAKKLDKTQAALALVLEIGKAVVATHQTNGSDKAIVRYLREGLFATDD